MLVTKLAYLFTFLFSCQILVHVRVGRAHSKPNILLILTDDQGLCVGTQRYVHLPIRMHAVIHACMCRSDWHCGCLYCRLPIEFNSSRIHAKVKQPCWRSWPWAAKLSRVNGRTQMCTNRICWNSHSYLDTELLKFRGCALSPEIIRKAAGCSVIAWWTPVFWILSVSILQNQALCRQQKRTQSHFIT